MSRKFKRFMKQIGFNKSLHEFLSSIMSDCTDNLIDFCEYRFEVNDVEYDIEPLIMIMPLLFNTDLNGIDIFKKGIHDMVIYREDDDGAIYDKSPVNRVGSLLNTIFNSMGENGLTISLLRSYEIVKYLGLYDGDFGGYDLSTLDDLTNEQFFNRRNDNNKITLSQIFETAVDTYAFKVFGADLIPSNFISLFFFISTIEDESEELNDIISFIRVVMEYFLESVINCPKEEFPLTFSISGDIEKDIKEINPDYLNLLDYLKNNNLIVSTLLDNKFTMTIDESLTIDYYSKIYCYIMLDFSYKLLYMNRRDSLKEIKLHHKSEIANYLKQEKKLHKEIKSLKKSLSSKDNDIKKLHKEISSLRNKNKEDYYLKQIKELNEKLKNAENKLEGANLRVKNLENKLTNKIYNEEDLENNNEVAISEEVTQEVIEEISEPIISYEEKVLALKDKYFLVVGGNANFFGRLKAVLPNSKHINVNDGCNFTVPKSTDCILNISKVTTHSHIRRAESQVSKDIPSIKISTYQVNEIINIIYDILIK